MSTIYRSGVLMMDNLDLTSIANEFGTPLYVYSQDAIEQNFEAYNQPLLKSKRKFKIHYAVKANSNLTILNLLAKLGAGFDVVSGGEIERVLAAGGNAQNIIFSGVGKSAQEITQALDLNIYSIHVESTAELMRIQEIAQANNKIADIAIRVNPNVHINSHPYISTGSKDNKFGIDYNQALETYLLAASLKNIKIKGIACHIGSQITTLDPILESIDQLLNLIRELNKHNIVLEYIDVGGGLGIRYQYENPPTPDTYVAALLNKLQSIDLELHIEPGRSIIGNAGLLLTKVEYLKQTADNNFAIVDAAMNDLIRPALYDSYHEILPVLEHNDGSKKPFSIVGPVCESGDFFAHKRMLNIQTNDLLAIMNCGAYGYSMSSNYNSRPRCAEVLITNNTAQLINRRETIQQIIQNELL